MSVKFNRIIHPNIQKELYVRHKALENRRGKYVPDNTNYYDRPWEKHARRNEYRVYKTYLRTLTQTLH